MQAVVSILGREFAIPCSGAEKKRLEDLARTLNGRLTGFASDADAEERLVLAALSLLDEVQVIGAARVRARREVERLTDMLAEADCEAPIPIVSDWRGRLAALRDVSGAA